MRAWTVLLLTASLPALASPPKFSLTPVHETFAAPARYDNADPFRRNLLEHGDIFHLDVPGTGGARLAVEHGYLNSRELKRIAADIAEALVEVPRQVGRGFITPHRITVYLYQINADRPSSYTAKIGVSKDEWGIMLVFAKDDEAPTFHEFTHMTEALFETATSESLSEGLADTIQHRIRPLKASAFTPAGVTAEDQARLALKKPQIGPVLELIGGDRDEIDFSALGFRFDFYWMSWSFVEFLARRYGIATVIRLLDGSGRDSIYIAETRATAAELRNDWRRGLSR